MKRYLNLAVVLILLIIACRPTNLAVTLTPATPAASPRLPMPTPTTAPEMPMPTATLAAQAPSLTQSPEADLSADLPDPTTLPQGLLITSLPPEADLTFLSLRHLLGHPDCRDANDRLLERFLLDPACNDLLINRALQQVYWMDVDHPDCETIGCPVGQITNLPCYLHGATASPDRAHILIRAGCTDTDADGRVTRSDATTIYMLDLPAGTVADWTDRLNGLIGLNNADWSPDGSRIVFSAVYPGHRHRLFTISKDGSELTQLTSDDDPYLDFDPSWSADGGRIAFARLPVQDTPWTIPAEIWVINADGSHAAQITTGGPSSEGQARHGPYPVGMDTDPDISPDGRRVVFDRLVSTDANGPFGNWFLYTADLTSAPDANITLLTPLGEARDMVPEWGPDGRLVFTRTVYDNDPMQITQTLILWQRGEERVLEAFPFTVFPVGGVSPKWIPKNKGLTDRG